MDARPSVISRIVAAQGGAGLPPTYLVQLADSGKRVQRSREQLEQQAPQLLKAFLATEDSSSSQSPAELASDSTGPESAAESVVEDSVSAEASSASSSSEEDQDETSDFDIVKHADPPKPRSKSQSAAKPTRSSGRLTKSNSTSSRDTRSFAEPSASTSQSSSDSEHQSFKGVFVPVLSKSGRSSARQRKQPKTYDENNSFSTSADELAIDSRSSSSDRPLRNRKTAKPAIQELDEEDDDEIERNLVETEEKPLPIEYKHRDVCAKCGSLPVELWLRNNQIARKSKKGRRRKVDEFDEDSDDEDDRIRKLGAWVECSVCVTSFHFGCLPAPLAKQLVATLKNEWDAAQAQPEQDVVMVLDSDGEAAQPPKPSPIKISKPKRERDANEVLTLAKCMFCKRAGGRKCFECGISGRKLDDEATSKRESDAKTEQHQQTDDSMQVDPKPADASQTEKAIPPLMFRCADCKRPCHYSCLGIEEGQEDAPRAPLHESYYKDGRCHQCFSWNLSLDVILAWRRDEDAVTTSQDVEADDIQVDFQKVHKVDEKTGKTHEIPAVEDLSAPAEYLCKWSGLSYRWLEWIPHSYLAAKYHQKLGNFLARGSLVSFAPPPPEDEQEEDANDEKFAKVGSAPLPDPDAESRIPVSWSTVDRVLDVVFIDKHAKERYYSDYSKRVPEDPEESVKLVFRAYLKWTELPYAASTWETPPAPGEKGYDHFVKAYCRFVESRDPSMRVPNLTSAQMNELDKPRSLSNFKALQSQPDFIKNGQLMDFQLAGVNFLYTKWWKRQGAVLADEMGLGKTVQVITFLSLLYNKAGARPFLVVVPNSTLGNWASEFERWAPAMRVVAYGGDAESRQIIEQYELFDHKGSLKSHVVLATYESLEKNASVFRRIARWDTLVVDEGQRLKSGSSGLLHKALNSLRIGSRVLLTGTPLNNAIGELFNLLRFIDPSNKSELNDLEARSGELTPAVIDEIRTTLQGYMLRRTKELVLQLPPLNEIVVPLTMTGLQRKLYTSILERNVDFIASIAKGPKGAATKTRKKGLNNILMELRKTLGHPYLVDQDIERTDVDRQQVFQNFVRASTKLELLAKLLPKLKAKGHKVLILSQFKLNLNILEDFLSGIDIKYLRLDGDTEMLDRQRRINQFQAPDSQLDCFILSTRAGGVGITLTAADTVIMYDADFNPHQDVQAISRAHRIGQEKPVRVFRLVVKGSCEEKIMAAGRDKMRLDYLIIQRVEEKSEAEDLDSILQFGAKALFDEKDFEKRAIVYTDELVDDLMKKADEPPQQDKHITEGAAAFAQFQVYEAGTVVDGEALGAPAEAEEDLHDFWSDILQKNEQEREQQRALAAELAGRGKRKKAAVDYRVDRIGGKADDEPLSQPKRVKTSSASGVSGGDEYRAKRSAASSDDDDFVLPGEPDDVVMLDREQQATSNPIGLAAPGDLVPKAKKARRKASEVADEKARQHAALDRAAQAERLRQVDASRTKNRDQYRRQRLDRLKEMATDFGDGKLIRIVQQAEASSDIVEIDALVQKAAIHLEKVYGDECVKAKAHLASSKAPLAQKPAAVNGGNDDARPRPAAVPTSAQASSVTTNSRPSSTADVIKAPAQPSSSSSRNPTQASTSTSKTTQASASTSMKGQTPPVSDAREAAGLRKYFSVFGNNSTKAS